MILNIIVLLFVLGMAVLWSTYGLFSAFIQLVLMIIAGAIAFAVWEPLTVGLLLNYLPDYAWSVGLIGPFFAVLLLLRVGVDKFVPGNMKLPKLADQILGAGVGAVCGVVAAGVTLIGVAFLPLPQSLLGYQPYEVKSNATIGVSEGDVTASLWVPADKWAAQMFSYLSRQGFATATPLAELYPDLFQHAGTHRIARFFDPNSSLVALPGNIEVTAAQTFTDELPGQLGEELITFLGSAPTRSGDQIVTVTTEWTHPRGEMTPDGILRVPPAQTQLVAEVSGQKGLQRYLPIGWTKLSDTSADRVFYFVANNQSMASNLASPADLVFVYAIPDNAEPKFFQARGVRFELPSDIASNDASALVAALGLPFQEGEAGEDEPRVVVSNPDAAARVSEEIVGGFANHKAVALEQTAGLARAISPNDATGLDVQDGVVVGGKDRTSKSARGGASARNIAVPGSLQPIRLTVTPTAASQSAVGNMVQGGTTDPEIWLEATNGRRFNGVAYSWLSDREQEVSIQTIDRTSDLPLNAYKQGDTLYVYFHVPPNFVLSKYHIGDQAYQEITYTVEDLPPARRR